MKTISMLAGSVLLLGSATASAAVLTPGNLTFTENFNSYTGVGYAPSSSVAAGQLPTDTHAIDGFTGGNGVGGAVDFGSTALTGNYARGINNGTNTTSGVYAFQITAGSDFALGALPSSGNFNPGSFYINIENQTGNPLTGFDLDYDVFVWDRAARSSSLNFSYAVANVATTPGAGTDPSTLSYTTVPAANFASPEGTPTDAFTLTGRMVSVTGLDVLAGQSVVLRWTSQDAGTTTGPARDGIGLDNISFTAVPEPASLALLGIGTLTLLPRRRRVH